MRAAIPAFPYNSCRNRRYLKRQALARAEWLEARAADQLPVPYFHVLTIPEPVAAIALQDQRVVYDILFRTAAATLKTIAADPRPERRDRLHRRAAHLGPGPAVSFPPALRRAGRWPGARRGTQDYLSAGLLPAGVLASLFRRLFREAFDAALRAGELSFHAGLGELAGPARFTQFLHAV
jgi:hypothetical protein